MYMSWLDAGSFWPLLLAVELLPGESCGARLQVSLLVSYLLCILACIAACRCLIFNIIA
jgi:hypothetical protein